MPVRATDSARRSSVVSHGMWFNLIYLNWVRTEVVPAIVYFCVLIVTPIGWKLYRYAVTMPIVLLMHLLLFVVAGVLQL